MRRIAAVHGWNSEISLVEKEQPWDLRQDYVVDPDEALRRTIQWERAHPPGVV